MLPAHQFGHLNLIAVSLQLQATQHIGDMTAEFPGVDRMPPDFAQHALGQGLTLVLAQHRGHLGLAARHQDNEPGAFFQSKADRIVGGGIAGMQRGDQVDPCRQFV